MAGNTSFFGRGGRAQLQKLIQSFAGVEFPRNLLIVAEKHQVSNTLFLCNVISLLCAILCSVISLLCFPCLNTTTSYLASQLQPYSPLRTSFLLVMWHYYQSGFIIHHSIILHLYCRSLPQDSIPVMYCSFHTAQFCVLGVPKGLFFS